MGGARTELDNITLYTHPEIIRNKERLIITFKLAFMTGKG